MTKQLNNKPYTYSANIPMVILGCPFLNTSEKVLMSLLINQSNTFQKQRDFSIKKERLLFYMGIKKRALIDIVRKKLIPKGLIINFKENSSNFDVILGDFTNSPELKRNALQKFISEDISKQDYDDFVSMLQDKLQQLEIEQSEIKKAMAESHTTSKISAIVEQLKEFLKFDTLTSEILLRFVDKIEVTENKDVKIYYKFTQVEGF
ncbi:hypothetical protein JOC78_003199 [Bacillus ectoiniformans]|uniref:DUF4368 domain-containing protein n=1 Tax=Bacillus ectoiniformans TaxID=1494429 RepID=UPI001EF8B99E|nr:DUF4368 domain-containing protein [Bacillus ectoiniformans]MBM7650215.1 hypothetical protein [Bacillus ectoiniformans]